MRFPRKIPGAIIGLIKSWNKNGRTAAKHLMMEMAVETNCTGVWNDYINQVKKQSPEKYLQWHVRHYSVNQK